MKHLRAAFAIGLLALALPVPALAQTEDGQRTPFNGAWVGIVGGYDHGTIKVTGTEPGGSDTLSSNRGFYGGAIGVDYKPKQIVYGFETEVSGGGFSRMGDGADSTERLRFGRDFYLGGRVGIPVTQNAMVYFKGGYSNLRVVGTHDGDDGAQMRDAMNLDGYRIGAGAQIEHGPTLARLEYRFSDYRRHRDVTIHRDQVAAVVGYRF